MKCPTIPNLSNPSGYSRKKSTWKRRRRSNAHEFKQIEGVRYYKDDIDAPATNEFTIRVVMVIDLVLRSCAELLDVKGAFLQG